VGEVGLGPQVQHTSATCVWAPISGVVTEEMNTNLMRAISIYEELHFAVWTLHSEGRDDLDWTRTPYVKMT
jgi:hypothetical protein